MNLCMKNYIVEYIRQCVKSMGSQMSYFNGYFILFEPKRICKNFHKIIE